MIKKLFIVFFFLMFQCSTILGVLEPLRGYRAYKKGNLDGAKKLYEKRIIDHPQDMETLYNMGTVLHKKGSYKDAHNYFERVASSSVNVKLKEQALFNDGNSLVKLGKLKEAITRYQEVLQLNAHNEQAQHNLKIVQKMLEKEEQKKKEQEQKEQQQDKKEQDKKDKKRPTEERKSRK